ncbi:hypothetical protein FOM02_13255 [Bradyrhizobium sp. SEMIA]|nr:hypothetical protein FOM02_13255 [Bradyrhizobium sp. SEMIA]
MIKKAFFALSVAAVLALVPSAASAQRGFHGGWHGGGWHGGGWGGGWRGGGWGAPAVGIGRRPWARPARASLGTRLGVGRTCLGTRLGSAGLELRSVWRLHAMASRLDWLGLEAQASERVLVRTRYSSRSWPGDSSRT